MSDIDETLEERGSIYGEFKSCAAISQGLKSMAMSYKNYKQLPLYQKEAIEMILHKIARQINGDSNYSDNFHDIAGYAKLAENEILKRNK